MAEPPPHVVPSTSAAPLAANPLPTPPSLPVQLLIAQAVCKLGTAASWESISQLLDQAEDWPASAPKMTTNGLEQAFIDMMRTRTLDPAACTEPHARPARKLIHSLYTTLLITLRDSLLSGHAQEMKLKGEISQIRSGQVDNLLVGSAPQIVKDRFQATQLLDAQAAQAQVQAQMVQQHSASPPAKPVEASLPMPEEIADNEKDATNSAEQIKAGDSPARRSGRKNSRQADDETAKPTSSPRRTGPELVDDDVEMNGVDATQQAEESSAVMNESAEKEGKKEKKGRKAAAGRKAKKKGGRRKKGEEAESEGEGVEGDQEAEEEDATVNDQNGEEPGVEQEQDLVQEQEKAEEEEEEEDVEEVEESRKRPGRKRVGGRTGGRPNKRKASAPPSSAAAGSPSAEAERSATPAPKRRKGRKSKAEGDAEQETLDSPESKESKALTSKRKAAFTRIVDSIRSLPFSNSFESKITRSIAPNYQAAVKRPICLKDIGKKIKSGEIKDSGELMRDFAILCANAVQFNGDEGEGSVGRQAQELWKRLERLMDETLSTEFNMENTGS